MRVGSESLPLCFFDLRHNNNPKAPQNEKQKNIKPSSLDRQDKDSYNVTRKQKDKNTSNKYNKVLVLTDSSHFFKKYQQPIIKF